MAETKRPVKVGNGKARTAYWQQKYMTKVLCNGHCSFAKLLFMRIASFGERGCWMNNETLAEELGIHERTVRRAVSSLWESGDLVITGWDGHGRTMYAARHPKVSETLNKRYHEMRTRGKVETVEQWRAKVRLRMRPEQGQI